MAAPAAEITSSFFSGAALLRKDLHGKNGLGPLSKLGSEGFLARENTPQQVSDFQFAVTTAPSETSAVIPTPKEERLWCRAHEACTVSALADVHVST